MGAAAIDMTGLMEPEAAAPPAPISPGLDKCDKEDDGEAADDGSWWDCLWCWDAGWSEADHKYGAVPREDEAPSAPYPLAIHS